MRPSSFLQCAPSEKITQSWRVLITISALAGEDIMPRRQPTPSIGRELMKIMRISNKYKMTAALALLIFALGFLGLPERTHAVSPPPDGGYAGGNTAEGQNALSSLTSGTYNTAVGLFSLLSLTDGSFNTATGAGALLVNTGSQNTATGAGALLSNTTGSGNTANGVFGLFNNTIGQNNTANGASALQSNTEGSDNTAVGRQALFSNTTGGSNTAIGDSALFSNTEGGLNTAVGLQALENNTAGNRNTASGLSALSGNDAGNDNTATGHEALHFNLGSGNTGVGSGALSENTTGNNNTSVGLSAGSSLTGDNNIDIGANVVGVAGENNTIRIGNTDTTTAIIRGISGQIITSGNAVFVASNGTLGTIVSSKRFKENIKPMDKSSEALFALEPVTFRYKKQIDPTGTQQFGLVAEEVEKVNADLVVRDENGQVNSVRYDQVNAMLLNEFLKAHRKIQEQEATITQLRKGLEAMVAHAKDQDSRLQKVSDQIEITKAASTVVRNNLQR
jgi:trimeric autotransporter adhesin